MHIEDLNVQTLLDGTYTNAELKLEVKSQGSGTVQMSLFEMPLYRFPGSSITNLEELPNHEVASASFPLSDGRGQLTIPVGNVRLWSAEEPN